MAKTKKGHGNGVYVIFFRNSHKLKPFILGDCWKSRESKNFWSW